MREYTYDDCVQMIANKYPNKSLEQYLQMAHIVFEIMENENESPERALLLQETYSNYWKKL